MLRQAATAQQDHVRQQLTKWALGSQNVVRHKGMIEMARTEPGVATTADQFDADSYALNTQSGILDLNTFALAAHDPERLHSKITGASYDPYAEAPFWLATVAKALPDPEVRDYVQQAFGLALRGVFSRYLFVPYGGGRNLKSTILNGVRGALGDYAAEAPADLLVEQQSGARSDSALASLRGVRLVTTIETAQGQKLAEVLVKQLTGEHQISAKYMHKDYFTYENQATVFLATNHKPVVQGADNAIWNRLRLIPFEYVVPDDEIMDEGDVARLLREEQDGILAWMVEGLRMHATKKLAIPAAVEEATASYRKDMDPVAEWLEDEVESCPSGRSPCLQSGCHTRTTATVVVPRP